jgi:hypothetical protein
MTVWDIVLMFIIITLIAIIINGIMDCGSKNSLNKLSFADSMGRLNLPIVNLTNKGNTYKFLIDTGASISIMDSRALDSIEHSKLNIEGNAYGIDGKIMSVNYISAELSSENISFTEQFQVMKLDAFDNLRETDGINLSGILGSSFLKAHGFVIDFENQVLSTKKN